jgi:hypothetical protein
VAVIIDPARGAQQPEALETTLESPFLETSPVGWTAAPGPAPVGEAPFLPETPFVSEYLADETVRPEAIAFHELLDELYDSEFDEAVAELAAEAETYVDALGLGETEADSARAERLLEAWVEPLRLETESMLTGMAEALEAQDPLSLTEDELDTLLDRFEPGESEHGPSFDGFLKKFIKKARGVVHGAIKAAKKGIATISKFMPIGIILRKLAVLVRPLLNRVLKFALNKLPVQYREPAAIVARKLFGMATGGAAGEGQDEAWSAEDFEDFEDSEDEQPATADVRQIQEAFDTEAASLLFAPSEQEQELFLAEAATTAARSSPNSLADLDAARQRFVDGVSRLDEGGDPTPLVENFVPAILPALRLGLKIAGRPRVVRFLAQYLGRLIAPYIGPSVTPGLSRAIVDAGLRSMTLEAEAEPGVAGEAEASPTIAGEAFASLVEDTVTRVSQLDEEDLADDRVLEAAAYEAFHESAAATFPAPVLAPESEYLEAGRAGGTWVAMPRRGPRRYRKYSQVFNVVIHPAAARSIRTFGGRPLSAFIRDGLGRSGPIRARIHLYQATPGTSLSGIARAERGVAGLGAGDRWARSRLHPLSPMAAATLLGEPGLGRTVSEAYEDGVGPLAIGQRLFYLEVPDAPTSPAATGASSGSPRKSSDATAVIDRAAGDVKVTIYLSEADAQSIAARLRKREPLGASLAALRRVYGPAIGKALGGGPTGSVQVKPDASDATAGGAASAGQSGTDAGTSSGSDAGNESEFEDEGGVEGEELVRGGFGRPFAGRGFGGRRAVARRRFLRRRVGRRPIRGRHGRFRRRPRFFRRRLLVGWITRTLAAELERIRDAFLQAADAPEDGVTITVGMRPAGLKLLLGRGPLRAGVAAAGPGRAQVDVKAGHPGG